MAATVKRLIGALPALALGLAAAQTVADDPTRPPAHLLARPAAAATPAGTPQAPDAPVLELQAIIRSADGTASATINGWVVRPGDSLSGMRVIEIGAQHALVESAAGRTRLSLTPGIRRTAHGESSRAGARPATVRNLDSGEKR